MGIVLYAASMWVTGIMEGLMWREDRCHTASWSTRFADTVAAKFPMYVVRGTGGVLYLAGAILMCWNLWQTAKGRVRSSEPLAVAAE